MCGARTAIPAKAGTHRRLRATLHSSGADAVKGLLSLNPFQGDFQGLGVGPRAGEGLPDLRVVLDRLGDDDLPGARLALDAGRRVDRAAEIVELSLVVDGHAGSL